jgi:hypothetical protein
LKIKDYLWKRIIFRRKNRLIDEENVRILVLLVFNRLGLKLPSEGQLPGGQKTGEVAFPLKNMVAVFCILWGDHTI